MLAAFEFVAHFVIDFGKCEGWYGGGSASYNIDQVLHVLSKVIWVLMWGTSSNERRELLQHLQYLRDARTPNLALSFEAALPGAGDSRACRWFTGSGNHARSLR
jgi:hypothetical protein